MRELLRRLRLKPLVSAQLLGATAMVNLLSFASPLFVMLILGQYVESGFDGTLYTLSAGMCIALLLQVGFRQVRTLMASQISEEPDRQLGQAVFEGLSRSRTLALGRVPEAKLREIPGMLHTVQGACAPANVCAVLDAPFSLLFVLTTFAFSLPLGVLGLALTGAMLMSGLLSLGASRSVARDADRSVAQCRGLAGMATDGADTVRMLGAAGYLGGMWASESGRLLGLRRSLADLRGRTGATQATISVLARVVVYAVGAYECVYGRLTFAELIVANIFVSRSLRQAAGFVAAGDQLARAGLALAELREFLRIPLESERGTALRRFSGRMELRDLAFAFPGSTGPLFESLALRLPSGSMTVFYGGNGSGKTTLARLLAGVLDPMRGEILADGITLRQMAPAWWRTQIAYMPQEPTFLRGTLRENILLAVADTDAAPDFDALVLRAGLGRYLDGLPDGAQTQIDDAGRTLPVGIRRRIALARALATGGRLAIFDEPFEGLDEDGIAAVISALKDMLRTGVTVVVLTHDPAPFAGANFFVNLNAKPVPEIRHGAPLPTAPETGGENNHGR